MVGCVLSQLKPSELYILSCGWPRPSVSAFPTAKSVELLGLYPILPPYCDGLSDFLFYELH